MLSRLVSILARFVSPDSIVPRTENSSLTVDFHEAGFISALGKEHNQLLQEGLFSGSRHPDGPDNPQQLNRYSYVLDNPVRYTDPIGHYALVETQQGFQLWLNAHEIRALLNAIGNPGNLFNAISVGVSFLTSLLGAAAGAGAAVVAGLTLPEISAFLTGFVLAVVLYSWYYAALADSGGSAMYGCDIIEGGCVIRNFWGNSMDVPDGANVYKWYPDRGAYNPRPCPSTGPCPQPAPVPVPEQENRRRTDQLGPRCDANHRFLCYGGAR